MKFTVSWLKDYLKTDKDLDTIVEAMTLAGLEVEEVENPAEKLASFTIAKVVKATKHPDADKLRVCIVKTKDGEKRIVCGAPNARKSMTAVYAPLGAYIPGLDFALDPKPRKLRGVESHGMMCSSRELEIGEDHDGIMDLETDAPIGTPVAEILGLDDPAIDFEVTPNRPDWLGVVGIARDLASSGLGKLNIQPVREVEGKFPCPIKVRTDAEDACPVFMGRLIRGMKNGPSPEWMQKRLKAIGINPKNMLVDVTNYVSFDRCRPLHAYDAAKLTGEVVARLGENGESFDALDDKTYKISSDMCVIADDSGVIGLGGVMGGASTASQPETVDVFIESALFDAMRTARTGRATGITSDARYRNERGIDPTSCREGLELATRLILDQCGGEPSDVVIAGSVPPDRDPVAFKPRDMKRLTGVKMSAARMRKILSALGFGAPKGAKLSDDSWAIEVPSFRRDITQSADIVEELIRIEGFDALPKDSLPRTSALSRPVTSPMQNRVRIVRRVMAARGFLEAVTWSFMDKDKATAFIGGDNNILTALMVDNPIASELNYMRPTALANLAIAAQRNTDHGAEEIRLFETGPVYLGDGPKDQKMAVTGLVKPKTPRHWAGASPTYDAFAAKADLFALLASLDQPGERFQIGEPPNSAWHPGRAGVLKLGPKNLVATFGELHPALLKSLDVDGPVIGFELILDALPQPKNKVGKTKTRLDKPELTPVRRDFAFIVDAATPASDLVKSAAGADKKLISSARIFDVYAGQGVPEGKVSIALEVTLQPREKTLTDDEIDAVADNVVKSVSKATGGELRG